MLITSDIKEIWILSKDGVTLFNQRLDRKEDAQKAQMLGGFISALHSFAQKLQIGAFDFMEFGDNRICFTFSEECGLIFVGLAHVSVKEKKLTELMTAIKTSFVGNFKEHLNGGLCDLSIFETARESISSKLNEWLGVSLKADQSKKLMDLL